MGAMCQTLAVPVQGTEVWTEQNTSSNFDLHGIAVARLETQQGPRSSFFIAGQGGIWRGDQPLAGEWELVLSEPGMFRSITGSRTTFQVSVEAVGEAGKVARSIDGTNWITDANGQAANFTAVAANDDLVVAVDDEGRIFTGSSVLGLSVRLQEDGVSWNGVAFGNSTWVIVGSDATVATSTNGLNWDVFPGALSDGLPLVDFHDVTFGPGFYQGGFFMAVGEEGFISTSVDGLDWTERQSGRGEGRRLRAAVFAAQHAAWIAMGDGGLGSISHNGAASFDNINLVFPHGMNALAYGLGFTVAVGEGGKVFSSVTRLNPTSVALSASPAGQISASAAGGTFDIQLTSTSGDARWRAEVVGTGNNPQPADFISVSPATGVGNSPSALSITVEPFGTIANRSGLVLLNDIRIPVVQAGDGDPLPVTTLDAEPLTDRAVKLKWRPSNGATHYEIQRRQSSNVEFTKIATVPGAENATGELEYTDQAGLFPNTSYCYQIVALNILEDQPAAFQPGGCPFGCGAGNASFVVEFGRAEEPSDEACATTLLTGTDGFFGELIGFEAIELHWNPVPGAQSYVLERSVAGSFVTIATPAGRANSFIDATIPDLDYGQSYLYRLTASGGVPRTTTVRTTVEPPTASVTAVDVPDVAAVTAAFDITSSRRDFLSIEVQTRVEPAGAWITIDLFDSLVALHSADNTGNIRAETWRFRQPTLTRSFRLRTRANGPSPPSEWISCGPVSTPPPPNPSSFAVDNRSSIQATFSWTDVPGERGYEVTARPASAIDDSQDKVIFTSPNATNAAVTGLFPGTSYDVFLVAVGVEGGNAVSRSTMGVSSATLTFSTLPRGPSTVTATARGPEFISVGWSQVSSATGYEVWRQEYVSPIGWTDYTLFTSTGSGTLSTSDFTVEGGHSYRYRVRAKFGDDVTNFKESEVVGTPVGAPDLVSATALSASSIALDWTDSNNAVLGYIVERANSSGGPWSTARIVSGLFEPPPTEATDSGLSAERIYFYRVKAFALFENESPASNVRSATTLRRLTVADKSSTAVTLTWDEQDDINDYRVERSTSGAGGPFSAAGSVLPKIGKFTDEKLSPSKIYYYRMRPALKSGFGAYTEVTEVATAPLPPAKLEADLLSSVEPQAVLKWEQGSTTDEYFIQWRPEGGSFSTIGTNDSGSVSFTHAGVLPGENDYRVRAAFKGSLSPYTAIETVSWNVAPEEQWRLNNFGTALNEGDAADEADPDQDGAPNEHERAAGTSPTDPSDFLHVTRVELAFPDLQIFWDGVQGVTYDVSESSNVIDFTPIESERRTSEGGEESVSVDLSDPLKVFRIEVAPFIPPP